MPKGFQTILTNLLGTWSRLILLVTLTGIPRPVDARSSFTARFADAVAGPGLEQTTRLIFDYFPGDGEAIIGMQGTVAGGMRFADITSVRGQAQLRETGFHIDFSENAIGSHLADTVAVRLLTPAQSLTLELSMTTNVEPSTNVDTPPRAAHRATVTLAIVAPLNVHLEIEPARLYPGESVELLLVADHSSEERGIDSVAVEWPEGVLPVGDPVVSGSGTDRIIEVRQSVRVNRDVSGSLLVEVSASGSGLRASPIAVPALVIAAVPNFEFEAPEDGVRRGETVRLHMYWRNESGVAIAARSLSASAAAGFVQARLVERGGTGGVDLEADEEKGSIEVGVEREGDLAPGEVVAVELEMTPLAPGPFTFTGRFQPADRTMPVPLAISLVQVVAPESELRLATSLARTDLELARDGLELELRQALASLPLARGAILRLSESRSDDGNWVVEGLLTDLLLERGVRVLADSSAASVLHYRLADARVVYSPSGSGWNMFDDKQRRDARMEVLLRLEDADGRVRWVRRVTSQNGEAMVPAAAAWLGGAKGVNQVAVTADHRAVEIGLSGLIAGGLFFVFFAP